MVHIEKELLIFSDDLSSPLHSPPWAVSLRFLEKYHPHLSLKSTTLTFPQLCPSIYSVTLNKLPAPRSSAVNKEQNLETKGWKSDWEYSKHQPAWYVGTDERVLDICAFLEPYNHTQMWSPSHCRTKIYFLRSQNSRIKRPQCNACAYACSAVSESMDCSPPGSPVHGIFQQEYCSGLPFPPSGDLSDPGTEPESLLPPALVGGFFTTVNYHFQITV